MEKSFFEKASDFVLNCNTHDKEQTLRNLEKEFLTGYYFQIGNLNVYPIEIEPYFLLDCYDEKGLTFSLNAEEAKRGYGCVKWHRWGFDVYVAIEKEKYFLRFLIRSAAIKLIDSEEIIIKCGPRRLRDAVLQANGFDNNDSPILDIKQFATHNLSNEIVLFAKRIIGKKWPEIWKNMKVRSVITTNRTIDSTTGYKIANKGDLVQNYINEKLGTGTMTKELADEAKKLIGYEMKEISDRL